MAFLDAHLPVTKFVAHYGSGSGQDGFPGHYRQFWMTLGYVPFTNVQYLMHQYKVMDYSTLGYYKFERTILLDRYDDAFRLQKAKRKTVDPKFVTENIAAPFCNSIP